MNRPVTRTSSQLLATTGLPAEITSLSQLSDVISILASITAPQIDVSGISITAAALQANNIGATTKSFLPIAAKALKALSTQAADFQKLRHGLQLVFRYIASPEYHAELAKSMIEQGLFDDLIEKKLDERLDGASGSGGRPSKVRKQRDPLIEEHMHYIVNKMVHRHYNKKGRVVISEQKEWPEPVAGGKANVEVAPGVFDQVWRPRWDDFLSNTDFIDEYLEQIEEEFADQHSEADLRSSLSVYFASINRGLADQASGKREEIKLQQNLSSRSNATVTTMTSSFDASLLNKCKERNFFRHAFKCGGVFIAPLSYKDRHCLPKPDSILGDGGEAKFDGFKLFADLWRGTKTEDGEDLFAVRDVEWWSELLALGFWTLYEQSRPTAPGQRSRVPLFHVPPPYRLNSSIESLPSLPAPAGPGSSSTSTRRQPKVVKNKLKTIGLCRGMVNARILDDEHYAVWCLGLQADPEVDETAAALPSLADLLADESNRALSRLARAHLKVMPERDVDVYRGLWRLRNEGTDDEYRQALVARDLEGHIAGIDWDSLGMYE